MSNGTSFTSAEEMQQAYNQLWEDISSFFSQVPSYFSEVLDFASENPVAIIVVSVFITMLAFYFLRLIISNFTGSSR